MKLYFYKTNAVSGITVEVCDAVEKPKTYCKESGVFPTYLSRVRKDDIGELKDWCVVLAEPNFEYAKSKFKKNAEQSVEYAKKDLETRENFLKAIIESEE